MHFYVVIYKYTVMAKNIGTLGKYDQKAVKMYQLWYFIKKEKKIQSQNSNLSLDSKN